MKKITTFILLMVFLLSATFFNIKAEEVTEISGATYQVTEVAETNELPYGVVQTRNIAQTSTSMSNYDADGYGGNTGLVEPGKLYPQQVNVLEVPTSQAVRITSWANLNNHKWTLTTVRGMINDYEDKHPGWKVIAAINGDFFDIGGAGNLPYQTSGAVASHGEYFKTSTGGLVGFANDGSVNSLVGNKGAVRTEFMKLAVYDENGEIIEEFDIQRINQAPGANETAVFYANYNSEKAIEPILVSVGTAKGFFVEDAELALPNSPTDFYGKGIISSLADEITLDKGQFGVVTNNPEVQAALQAGVKIRCQFEFTGAYANVEDISGGGTTIMEEGAVNPDGGLNDRAPRTVIGRKADGTIVMMVIDGRQANKDMFGADRTELAAIMSHYGCIEAYNLDGGGSSTMVIRQGGEFRVMNSPSDGQERTDSNCILIVARDPELQMETTDITGNSFKLNANITDVNGHDIQELFVEINNNIVSLEEGTVLIEDLNYNSEYVYNFYYRNSQDEMIRIIQDGKARTLKRIPQFQKLIIQETSLTYEVQLLYDDPDNASTMSSCYIFLNGKRTSFYGGKASLKKVNFGEEIQTVAIRYSYNINDGKTIVVDLPIEDYDYCFSVDHVINQIILIQKGCIEEIYK